MEYFTLNNNVIVPKLGMGGWSQKKDNITDAINCGYRLFDTAAQYGNEDEIGVAIKNSGIPRSEFFISTKLWVDDIKYERVRNAFEESLLRLGTDYVDLYLIHWPSVGFEKAYLEMEAIYREGKVRAIGVSNFEPHHLDELKGYGATVTPAVNQIECHPYLLNEKIIKYCDSLGIIPEAWCPLGGPDSGEITEKKIIDIALKYGKTPAQILLRWHIQRGTIVIPKTTHIDRMKTNIDVFNFDLGIEDMEQINSLNRNKRLGPHPDLFDKA